MLLSTRYLLIVILVALAAKAQVAASISGTVVDTSGGALAGVTIVVTSLETGSQRQTITDASGNFSVLALPLGATEVRAEKAGFKYDLSVSRLAPADTSA